MKSPFKRADKAKPVEEKQAAPAEPKPQELVTETVIVPLAVQTAEEVQRAANHSKHSERTYNGGKALP